MYLLTKIDHCIPPSSNQLELINTLSSDFYDNS